MSLSSGTRVGPHVIVAPLGAGGMGEVYRATDSRLKREVAVKILPPAVAADPDRLARFQREAELLASVNHPNIAAVYGLEDAVPNRGPANVTALVMELVEGPTLADRISEGPIPIQEGLSIARQTAEAQEGYVQPHPGPGARVRISTAGGAEPVWAPDGRDILYRVVSNESSSFLSAPVNSLSPFRTDTPRVLFNPKQWDFDTTFPSRSWDISPDGRRFLLLRNQPLGDKPVTVMHVVINWAEELKRRVPAK